MQLASSRPCWIVVVPLVVAIVFVVVNVITNRLVCNRSGGLPSS
jgi:hypothetical protein